MIGEPDPRITPWRPDLAAAGLRGTVTADRYVEAAPHGVIAAIAPIRVAPRGDATLASEALFGETFNVLEARGGWAWGQLQTDGYVGYLPVDLLGPPPPAATHRVAALRGYLYPAPDIKVPALALLSMNSRVAVAGTEGDFARLATGGFVFSGHLEAIAKPERDPVDIALRFVGTPYLWGGRTSLGLDCSALVQLSLAACGIACPRDSDLQQAAFGGGMACDGVPDDLRRGDLLFWKGHVAIAVDAATLVHANAHHMATAVEPLAEAIRRIAPLAGKGWIVRQPFPGRHVEVPA